MQVSRRTVLQLAPVVGAATQSASERRLKTRRSVDIAASPISIGFETLDRKMFEPERTYSHVAELGVKWARCQTGWSRCEPRKGEFDFAWLDSVVDSLLKIGVQPWFNLGFGNILYTPGAPHPSAVGWAPVFSEEAKRAWVRFVEKLAEHYRGRVKHWEIWNEPNIASFWRPNEPKAGDYAALVKMTAPVIRRRVPGAVIIGGSLAGVPLDYLEECFKAGLGAHVEKISFHPYRAVPEWNYAAEVRALRALTARYKPGIQLWQGENGAPSSSAKDSTGALSNLAWNELSQAKWLLRRLLTDLWLGLELTSYFLIVDIVNYVRHMGPTDLTNYKGVLRGREYTRKPSYHALQNLCSLFDSESKPAELLIRFDNGGGPLEEMLLSSASFLRQGRPLYAYWYPAVLQQDFQERRARITVWSGRDARLQEPVLADLLSGEIRAPAGASQKGDFWYFDSSPVRDYPLLITDRSLVA